MDESRAMLNYELQRAWLQSGGNEGAKARLKWAKEYLKKHERVEIEVINNGTARTV